MRNMSFALMGADPMTHLKLFTDFRAPHLSFRIEVEDRGSFAANRRDLEFVRRWIDECLAEDWMRDRPDPSDTELEPIP